MRKQILRCSIYLISIFSLPGVSRKEQINKPRRVHAVSGNRGVNCRGGASWECRLRLGGPGARVARAGGESGLAGTAARWWAGESECVDRDVIPRRRGLAEGRFRGGGEAGGRAGTRRYIVEVSSRRGPFRLCCVVARTPVTGWSFANPAWGGYTRAVHTRC